MNCVVTAGPTCEPLDKVRAMTNFSTGQLGSQLANYLAEHGHRVILLRGRLSTFKVPLKVPEVIEFATTADLQKRFRTLAKKRIDAIFHAAAVSDFRFGKVWANSVDRKLKVVKKGKISSREPRLIAELIPTTKLILRLRGWFPRAFLVGWKYEVDGTRSTAIARAKEQIAHSDTDACVVNGPAYGHGFYLVAREGSSQHLPNSAALFECLEQTFRTRS